MIVDQFETWLIKFCSCMGLGNGQANSICETLAQRTSGDFNTWGILSLGMTGGDAINGLEMDALAQEHTLNSIV